MSKSAKNRSTANLSAISAAKQSHPTAAKPKTKKANSGSKQSRLLTMLQSPAGVTIAAMMKGTGWQQHSIRGFLAGVVRKRLELNLVSKKVDGKRVYRVASGVSASTDSLRADRPVP